MTKHTFEKVCLRVLYDDSILISDIILISDSVYRRLKLNHRHCCFFTNHKIASLFIQKLKERTKKRNFKIQQIGKSTLQVTKFSENLLLSPIMILLGFKQSNSAFVSLRNSGEKKIFSVLYLFL